MRKRFEAFCFEHIASQAALLRLQTRAGEPYALPYHRHQPLLIVYNYSYMTTYAYFLFIYDYL